MTSAVEPDMRNRALWVVGCAMALVACGGDSGGGVSRTGGGSGTGSVTGTGASPGTGGSSSGNPCDEWKTALCGWGQTCAGVDPASCTDELTYVQCNSDTTAASCATKLQALACASPPAGCDVTDLADRTAASQACNRLVSTLCQSLSRCGQDPTNCSSNVMAGLDCTTAIAVKPEIDTCINDTANLSCNSLQAPPSCQGIIVVIQ